jgi:hypothetical protein
LRNPSGLGRSILFSQSLRTSSALRETWHLSRSSLVAGSFPSALQESHQSTRCRHSRLPIWMRCSSTES